MRVEADAGLTELRQRPEEVRCLGAGSARQQIPQVGLQDGKLRREVCQPLLALGRRQIQRLIEQPIQCGRTLRIEIQSRHRPIRVCFAVRYDDQRAQRTFNWPALVRAADGPSPSPGGSYGR